MKNLQVSNNMIRGNQGLNGYTKVSSNNKGFEGFLSRNISEHNVLTENANSNEAGNNDFHDSTKLFSIKDVSNDEEFVSKIRMHSIIGIGNEESMHKSKITQSSKVRAKKCNFRSTHHEILQRIDQTHEEEFNNYQKYWFSAGLERLKIEEKSREERLEITRYELRRHLKQLTRSNVGTKSPFCSWNGSSVLESLNHINVSTSMDSQPPSPMDRLVESRPCDSPNCKKPALPCARNCTLHIMHNTDQVLFSYCTAKFADNTQCSVPVFDIFHELPLCVEHARKRDNYKMNQEAKPKKLRKKVKSSAMIRPQKRNKKKKKAVINNISNNGSNIVGHHIEVPPCNIIENSEISDEILTDVPDDSEDLGEDMVEQVLALEEPLELANVDQVLVTQATRLLEETDITNVLSTIQVEEFNDFFTVNRNGDYEPTREETEELERALAAVDNDVKSLEKLSQSQGLLGEYMDDHNLVESLVQSSIVPDVFHNGFNTCGDNMVVAQTSRLLSVQPHSHS